MKQKYIKGAATVYHVINGDGLKVGTVVWQKRVKAQGWQFFPLYQAQASRKLWETPEQAICNRLKFFTLEAVDSHR